jgi:hypothetical protein
LISNNQAINSSVDQVSISNSLYSDGSISGDIIFCIVNKESLTIELSPNPFIDHLMINSNTKNPLDIRFYSMDGKLMHSSQFIRDGDYIPCRHLIGGPYIISVKDRINKREAQQKVIKVFQ